MSYEGSSHTIHQTAWWEERSHSNLIFVFWLSISNNHSSNKLLNAIIVEFKHHCISYKAPHILLRSSSHSVNHSQQLGSTTIILMTEPSLTNLAVSWEQEFLLLQHDLHQLKSFWMFGPQSQHCLASLKLWNQIAIEQFKSFEGKDIETFGQRIQIPFVHRFPKWITKGHPLIASP